MKSLNISRRNFLKAAAVSGLATPLYMCATATGPAPAPVPVPAPKRRVIPADVKLNHACIGVGGMGWGDLQNFKQHSGTQIVALCDVDSNTLAKAAKEIPGARTYSDWRELFEKEGDKIDSVNVTVPDHSHFIIAMAAIARGKHVYCQKPLCHDVAEIRMMTNAAVKMNVVTQLGTQQASGSNDRMAVQMIKEGVIGKIKRAYLCSNRPGAQEAYRLMGPRPAAGGTPPATLNWDVWIGNAPMRPFAPGIYHPTKWRAWQDFGTGWSGDIGCHIFDAVWKALSLTAPKTFFAEVQKSWKDSPARRADTWPQSNHITWIFPGTKMTAGDELTLEWFDGEFYPPDDIRKLYTDDFAKYPAESAMLIGEGGAILMPHGGTSPILLPREKFPKPKYPQLKPRNHYHHFLDACRGGEMCESHFAQTGPMAEAIILGTVAIRVPDTQLQWSAPKLRIPNNAEAERILRRQYREGWKAAEV
ncbi:MAG: Gfo/Idh/MocA family oxidoreductase [Candidatus Sumerlaeota bacterium]|nr:Gfo/Idh/MocA family oxidoreductase [Candidatus Sumerlaeota bacterium]